MTHDLYHAIYRVASVLEVPVIILALIALLVAVLETGAFAAELRARRRRRGGRQGVAALSAATQQARAALRDGDEDAARTALSTVSWSSAMDVAYAALVDHAGRPDQDTALAKDLADFDLGREARLGRTRLLVRTGPALGLMGTLIPLSPALEGLAKGNVTTLTENLRVAFSVTVLGLFVGAIAFALSLVRERMYGQDYSDLEYVAALLSADADADGAAEVTP